MWENDWFHYVSTTDIDMEYDPCKFDLLWKPPLTLLDCSMKSETTQIKAWSPG